MNDTIRYRRGGRPPAAGDVADDDQVGIDLLGDLDEDLRRIADLQVLDDAHSMPLGGVVPDRHRGASGVAG